MKNPLSLEERLVVARRFPVHEILGNLTLLNAQNTLLSPIVQGRNYRKKNSVIIKHLADCIEAFSAVAQDDIILRYNSQREFQEVFQRLEESGKALLLPDVKTRFYSNRGLETNTHLVYAMLFNLMKNSARQKKWFSGINITLEATPYEGQLRNPAYISARTPLKENFSELMCMITEKDFPLEGLTEITSD